MGQSNYHINRIGFPRYPHDLPMKWVLGNTHITWSLRSQRFGGNISFRSTRIIGQGSSSCSDCGAGFYEGPTSVRPQTAAGLEYRKSQSDAFQCCREHCSLIDICKVHYLCFFFKCFFSYRETIGFSRHFHVHSMQHFVAIPRL